MGATPERTLGWCGILTVTLLREGWTLAEPLKHSFGPDVAGRIADMIEVVEPGFDRVTFLRLALADYESLELTQRARRVSDALAEVLPADRTRALEILIESLGAESAAAELTGMGSFIYLPHVFFVAEHGLDDFETSMRAQYELTKRFTAEFSIRAYIEKYPERTLQRLKEWAAEPNVHVRRLVSEGTRPRLPWASRLRGFQEDPAPVLELLEMLRDDPEEYVRRSVANNLNDISKDHPEVVVGLARRWWNDGDGDRKRLIRHALRTLIKAGNAGALEVLGYGADSSVVVRSVTCEPGSPEIGAKVRIEVEIENPGAGDQAVLVDLRIHFMKANGRERPKVFKGGERRVAPGGRTTIRKTVSLAQHSTRTHYPGEHRVEILINGVTHSGATFEVRQPTS